MRDLADTGARDVVAATPLPPRRHWGVIGLAAAATLLLLPRAAPRPWVIWNASASLPIGLYAISPPRAVTVGNLVIARVPAPWRGLAARRRYIPSGVPLLKRVAALSGAIVCATGADILIDGRRAAVRQATDQSGRRLPWWEGCRVLGEGEVFLLAPSVASFDGRYMGPTSGDGIIGKARPLWLP